MEVKVSAVKRGTGLGGQTMYGTGSGHMTRCNLEQLRDHRVRGDVEVAGPDGQVKGPPAVGSATDGPDVLHDVPRTPNVDHSTDAPCRLVDVLGYEEDGSAPGGTTRLVRRQGSRTTERVYRRSEGEAHWTRVAATSCRPELAEQVVGRVYVTHEQVGHLHPRQVPYLTTVYGEAILGYSRLEAKLLVARLQCAGCEKGRTARRPKGTKSRLLLEEYHRYGGREGLRTGAVLVGDRWAPLVCKSQRYRMQWTTEVGADYGHSEAQVTLEVVLGDCRCASRACSFVRGDAGPRLAPIPQWLTLQGVGPYLSPRGTRATKAELSARRLKESTRARTAALEYRVPEDLVPGLVAFCSCTGTTRHRKGLGTSPGQAFFDEPASEYRLELTPAPGTVVPYQDTEAKSSVLRQGVHYGAAVGAGPTTGSLLAHSLAAQTEDRVPQSAPVVKVSGATRHYFNNYERVRGPPCGPKVYTGSTGDVQRTQAQEGPQSEGPLEHALSSAEVGQTSVSTVPLSGLEEPCDDRVSDDTKATEVDTLRHESREGHAVEQAAAGTDSLVVGVVSEPGTDTEQDADMLVSAARELGTSLASADVSSLLSDSYSGNLHVISSLAQVSYRAVRRATEKERQHLIGGAGLSVYRYSTACTCTGPGPPR